MEPMEAVLWALITALALALLLDMTVLTRHPEKWRKRMAANCGTTAAHDFGTYPCTLRLTRTDSAPVVRRD